MVGRRGRRPVGRARASAGPLSAAAPAQPAAPASVTATAAATVTTAATATAIGRRSFPVATFTPGSNTFISRRLYVEVGYRQIKVDEMGGKKGNVGLGPSTFASIRHSDIPW